MSKSSLKRIHDAFDALTYSEKLVASYIMNNAAQVKSISIQNLAELLNVSTSTVFNLVKKLGYSGFSEFKIDLASESAVFEKAILPMKAENRSNAELFERLVSMNIQSFAYMRDNFDVDLFSEVVEKIATARRVVLFGLGGSGALCYNTFNYLLRTGIDCHFSTDYHLQLFQTTTLGVGDVAVVYSITGVNKDILSLVDRIHETGASIIGISNFNGTPFAKSVDHILYIVNENQRFEDKKYILAAAHMCLAEALYHAVSRRLGKTAQAISEKAEEIFDAFSF